MVRASYDQKPYRRIMMESFGATCYPSPSKQTKAGRKILEEDPNNQGSLGIAISEAVEDALVNEKEANYAIGSVFNHVLLHQTVEGIEAKKQLEIAGDYPDVLFGCIGGGSSFSGFFWPFYYDKDRARAKPLDGESINRLEPAVLRKLLCDQMIAKLYGAVPRIAFHSILDKSEARCLIKIQVFLRLPSRGDVYVINDKHIGLKAPHLGFSLLSDYLRLQFRGGDALPLLLQEEQKQAPAGRKRKAGLDASISLFKFIRHTFPGIKAPSFHTARARLDHT